MKYIAKDSNVGRIAVDDFDCCQYGDDVRNVIEVSQNRYSRRVSNPASNWTKYQHINEEEVRTSSSAKNSRDFNAANSSAEMSRDTCVISSSRI